MDEQNNQYQLLEKDEATAEATPEEAPEQETDVVAEKVIIKKKKKKKKRKQMSKQSSDAMTQFVLIGILFVGICLLCVSLFGIFTALGNVSNSEPVDETTTASSNQSNSVIADAETTTLNTDVIVNEDSENTENKDDAADDNADSNDNQNSSDTPANAPQSDAEWLAFFSNAVNKLKTDGPSFTKAKRTQTADIQLSNPLGQAYVSVAKDKYLSDDTVTTDVAKGDTSNAVAIVSPDGESYVSNLSMSDIKSISHTTTSDGNYEITINMPDATNPDLSSAYGKIFEFMLVDDVMETYAPNMGATVARENVSLKYSGCYAKAVITPEGKLVKYETKVNANMILKDAEVSVVTTDLDVTLFSDTSYTNIVW